MLLPHGYEGQGPEHSSARIERFLTLAAGDNIQVCNATTAAQFFHLLRRQVRRDVRKPLVVFTPKSLLRAKTTRSPVSEFIHGSFEEVLDDKGVTDPASVRRIVFASGKVGVEAQAVRDEMGAPVAVVRVEQLYPWPYAAVARIVEKYANADEIVWLQEEPENMGAWNHIKGRLYEAHDDTHVSRQESASPATGSHAIHQAEVHDLMESALGGI
jgi:2-oxoglutarate dehydrogenase E1 component